MQTDKEKIKELEAKIGQIREHTKNRPYLSIRPDGTTDEATLRDFLFKLQDFWMKLEELLK